MNNFYPEQYAKTGTYPINHNYLSQQFADHELIWQKVQQVVVKGDFTLGDAVDELERSFASLNDGQFGIGVGSGTDALFLSLKVLGIGAGDEVITTPFTFYATIGAIVTAGAIPVFVDVDESFNINPDLIENAITDKTKAIMPVHWAGHPCDMQKINSIAAKHDIKVVADACHAISAKLDGQGMAKHSDLTCFSMHPLKNLNVWGDGGIIITNCQALAEQLSLLRNHGLANRDECQVFAYNSRLDTIQAVIAQHIIDEKLHSITDGRIRNAAYLDQALMSMPQIKLPPRTANRKSVYHLYSGIFERRDELQTFLQSRGIDAKVHYPVPMHLQPAAKDLGYTRGDFPQSEFTAENVMSLPVHEHITSEQCDVMIESIQYFYEKR